jgi:hypothetical protein
MGKLLRLCCNGFIAGGLIVVRTFCAFCTITLDTVCEVFRPPTVATASAVAPRAATPIVPRTPDPKPVVPPAVKRIALPAPSAKPASPKVAPVARPQLTSAAVLAAPKAAVEHSSLAQPAARERVPTGKFDVPVNRPNDAITEAPIPTTVSHPRRATGCRITLAILYFAFIATWRCMGGGWLEIGTAVAEDFIVSCEPLQKRLSGWIDRLCLWFPPLDTVRTAFSYATSRETGRGLLHKLLHEIEEAVGVRVDRLLLSS